MKADFRRSALEVKADFQKAPSWSVPSSSKGCAPGEGKPPVARQSLDESKRKAGGLFINLLFHMYTIPWYLSRVIDVASYALQPINWHSTIVIDGCTAPSRTCSRSRGCCFGTFQIDSTTAPSSSFARTCCWLIESKRP